MPISLHDMAAGTFVPMLESLSAILGKGEAHAKSAGLDLVAARLPPDMYPLALQIKLACDQAGDCCAKLSGRDAPKAEDADTSIADMQARISRTVQFIKGIPASAYEGSETQDCSIPIPNNMIIEMDGVRFLKSWALPHFYFHVVTAYDILRREGVVIGKQDYLSQVGGFIRTTQKS